MTGASTTQYHAHFDCFSGAAGDMLLAACLDAADSLPHALLLLDASADANTIEVAPESKQSEKLLAQISHDLENGLPEMKGEFKLSLERVWRSTGMIAAKKLHVKSIYQHKAAPVPSAQDHHSHEHSHSHSHNHHHSHEHSDNHHSHEHNHSKADLTKPQPQKDLHHSHDHAHSSQNHHNHSHHHSHQGKDEEADHHAHSKLRNLPHIAKMLKEAPPRYIPRKVASLAIEAFTALAQAEMHTHGAESIDHVHFHEVGAVDSIVDTVGTLLALNYLSVDLGSGNGQDCSITCSRLPMGEGTVWTDHGLLPVPAPATLRLMIGMPTCPGPSGVTGELVTPTAAALLRVLTGVNNQAENGKDENYWQPKVIDGRPPSMTPRAVGLGAGTKDFEKHPNVLRLVLGDISPRKQTNIATVANDEIATAVANDGEVKRNDTENVSAEARNKSEEVNISELKVDADKESCQLWNINTLTHLEANIDDATPELMAHVIDLLLENGAIDVWIVNIVMKKGRPAHTLNCICHDDKTNESNLLAVMFRHTTTLGIRIHRNIKRASLQRRFFKVQLPYTDNSIGGEVDVKVSSFKNDEVVSLKAEFDQCKIVSKESNVPLKIVSSTAERLAWQLI